MARHPAPHGQLEFFEVPLSLADLHSATRVATALPRATPRLLSCRRPSATPPIGQSVCDGSRVAQRASIPPSIQAHDAGQLFSLDMTRRDFLRSGNPGWGTRRSGISSRLGAASTGELENAFHGTFRDARQKRGFSFAAFLKRLRSWTHGGTSCPARAPRIFRGALR